MLIAAERQVFGGTASGAHPAPGFCGSPPGPPGPGLSGERQRPGCVLCAGRCALGRQPSGGQAESPARLELLC